MKFNMIEIQSIIVSLLIRSSSSLADVQHKPTKAFNSRKGVYSISFLTLSLPDIYSYLFKVNSMSWKSYSNTWIFPINEKHFFWIQLINILPYNNK